MSVLQFGAVCSVFTAVSEKRSALVCVMLGTVELTVQVRVVCFIVYNYNCVDD